MEDNKVHTYTKIKKVTFFNLSVWHISSGLFMRYLLNLTRIR